jgi:phosphatidylglycerophosphatase C
MPGVDGRPAPQRRLALFDLDGTITRRDSFQGFVLGLLARHPGRLLRLPLLLAPVAGFLLRVIDRGALKGAILHLLFGGLPRAAVGHWAALYAAEVVPARLFPDAVAAVRGHLQAGDHVVLLSASPDLYVPEIGRLLGIAEVHCTAVRWNGERLDGRLAGPNRRDHEKSRVLDGLRAAHPGLPVIAYGNSAPDLVHMQRCEEAVYVNPQARLHALLAAHGIRAVHWR